MYLVFSKPGNRDSGLWRENKKIKIQISLLQQIFDSRHQYYLRKNKKTKYIQTWHGTPLKKLALDMEKVNMSGHQNIEKYRENFAKNSSTWDYLISQNSYSSEIFKRAFAFDGEMLEIGYPRNDILVNENNETKINEIKSKLGIDKDKKTYFMHQHGEIMNITTAEFTSLQQKWILMQ